MMPRLADAIATGPFSIVVELVASGVKREAQLLEIASNLACLPEVAAGSIASYADTRVGPDPLRVGCAVRARGLQPTIQLTCVNRDRVAMRQMLRTMRALGLFDVFATTGQRPTGSGDPPPGPEFDSVQLTEMIAQMRASDAAPFHIAVSVSPFHYAREECVGQYARLERKVAAGANLAITHAGWDARKFAELKRYVDERGLGIPLLGHVSVLNRRDAEQLVSADRPGRRVPPALLDLLRKESEAGDGGLRARLERAAMTVAVLKGLGYAGVYLSGTSIPEHITEILHRGREFEGRWQRCADDLQFGAPGGFYLESAAWSPPGAPGVTTVQPAPSQS